MPTGLNLCSYHQGFSLFACDTFCKEPVTLVCGCAWDYGQDVHLVGRLLKLLKLPVKLALDSPFPTLKIFSHSLHVAAAFKLIDQA